MAWICPSPIWEIGTADPEALDSTKVEPEDTKDDGWTEEMELGTTEDTEDMAAGVKSATTSVPVVD